MPKRLADKALVRKHAREIEHRLRVVAVLERTMNAAHKLWWRKIKQQEVLIRNLERVEKQLKSELTNMNKRKSSQRAGNDQRRLVSGAAPRRDHERFLPKDLTNVAAQSAHERPAPSSARFQKFVALSFEPTRLVTPGLTLEAWRVLAAQEWTMKSEGERSLYGEGSVR
jgi:hypothetical protein